jgi:hypothetical protein
MSRLLQSRFELAPRQAGLPDDRAESAHPQFLMVRYGHRRRAPGFLPLHDNMAAAPADFHETVSAQKGTHVAAGHHLEPTHR